MLWRRVTLLFAVFCFVSFAWGMIWHFKKPVRRTPSLIVTGLCGVSFAVLHLTAIALRPVRFPVAALPLYALSGMLYWWAVFVTRGKLSACGLGQLSNEIVMRGPYRFVRHPFYAAYNLAWIAGCAASAWWPLAVTAVVMASLYESFAQVEERSFLNSDFAREYGEYRRQTGKYLPFIRTQ